MNPGDLYLLSIIAEHEQVDGGDDHELVVTNRTAIARSALISSRMPSVLPDIRDCSPAKKKGGELASAALKPTSTTIYGVNVRASGLPRS